MASLLDTSPDAERMLVETYRRLPPGEKWLRLGLMYADARALHQAGCRLRNAGASPTDILRAWLAVNLGLKHLKPKEGAAVEQPISILQETRVVLRVFAGLGIPCAVGGSVASSLHGIDRYTRDAAITADPFAGQEASFVAAFGPDYYVSLTAVEDANRRRASFNIINTATGFKADVFVRKDSAFEQSALKRRLALALPDLPAEAVPLLTAEDIILFKLTWYRLGGESSEQQWRDVIGVMQVQGERLDQSYLDQHAPEIGVHDLLARARQECAK